MQIPLVDYLVLGDEPYLQAHECTACRARFFGRRNGCAQCGARSFDVVQVSNTGTLRTFSIVHRAAPSIPTPYVSAIVHTDDGTSVRANLVGIEPDPESIKLGMKVKLDTYVVGTDDEGQEAVAFGYAPA
ncbi:Zn-ribbon domain-containing OB-fold protein [Candidatus Poriferisocius sp.]|uniref:Zn-ribbon domain-containing OB-fold protein n=1 Tax=Candidatus Poriferisocius sp. TaxID=3101276 RepID=UPI003B02AFB0